MKSKLYYLFSILTIAGLILLTACQDKPLDGSVTGKITIYDPASPLVKTPREGIRVYVVNKDYQLDSVDYANNEAGVVGSDVTNIGGEYLISGIPEGNYSVVAVPDSIMYRFQADSESDTMNFRISETSLEHTVNFKAAVPEPTNDSFHIRVKVINRPNGGLITLFRPIFIYNIFPTFNAVGIDSYYRIPDSEFLVQQHFGIFNSLYAVSNNFKVHAMDLSGKYLFTCWIEYNYFNTPAQSEWEIDWATERATRIQ